jgi:hypothetical protein
MARMPEVPVRSSPRPEHYRLSVTLATTLFFYCAAISPGIGTKLTKTTVARMNLALSTVGAFSLVTLCRYSVLDRGCFRFKIQATPAAAATSSTT